MAAPASTESLKDRICAELTKAGPFGLHASDIGKLVGEESAVAIMNELAKLKVIERLPGSKWKLMPKTVGNGAGKPNLHLPGSGSFSSYKNSLQEYCQKKKMDVPTYKTMSRGPINNPNRPGPGSFQHYRMQATGRFISTLTYSDVTLEGKIERKTAKDAEQQVAFEALKDLGYFKEEDTLDEKFLYNAGQKRHSAGGDPLKAPPSKIAHIASFKSKLAEIAQKAKLTHPVYSTEPRSGGFVSTVSFNGNDYVGMPQGKKKAAEHNAAHICLFRIKQVEEAPAGYVISAEEGKPAVKQVISELRFMSSTPLSASAPIATLKERLNEYCKSKAVMAPTCKTAQQEDGKFMTTMFVESRVFQGDSCASLKEAEQSVTRKACIALQLAATSEE